MFILQKHLVLYVERPGYKLTAMFATFVCISYFALQICIDLIMKYIPHLRRKKADKVCIFSQNHNIV